MRELPSFRNHRNIRPPYQPNKSSQRMKACAYGEVLLLKRKKPATNGRAARLCD